MIKQKTRKQDDSGTTVLLEYVFLMTITAILFSVFILVLYTIFVDVDQVVIGDELSIVANDVANRISGFSGDVYVNQYGDPYVGSSIPGSGEMIELPGLVNGQNYKISVNYDAASKSGNVTIHYQSEITLNETAGFHSDIPVTPVSVYSPSQQLKMYYDKAGNRIVLEGA